MPRQDVEKLGADIDVPGVERDMKALAEAAKDVAALHAALNGLPRAYVTWARVPGRHGLPSGGRSASGDRAEMPR
jgi:hypothetical protein